MSPFDFINGISNGKNVMTEENKNEFNAFLTNKHFSYFQDTIFISNEMNGLPLVDGDQCFSFYINIVRPKKRFTKWIKAEENEDLQAVSKYFNYSLDKSRQTVVLLSREELDEIKKKLFVGGVIKKVK